MSMFPRYRGYIPTFPRYRDWLPTLSDFARNPRPHRTEEIDLGNGVSVTRRIWLDDEPKNQDPNTHTG
jgi:hypothetical protein